MLQRAPLRRRVRCRASPSDWRPRWVGSAPPRCRQCRHSSSVGTPPECTAPPGNSRRNHHRMEARNARCRHGARCRHCHRSIGNCGCRRSPWCLRKGLGRQRCSRTARGTGRKHRGSWRHMGCPRAAHWLGRTGSDCGSAGRRCPDAGVGRRIRRWRIGCYRHIGVGIVRCRRRGSRIARRSSKLRRVRGHRGLCRSTAAR